MTISVESDPDAGRVVLMSILEPPPRETKRADQARLCCCPNVDPSGNDSEGDGCTNPPGRAGETGRVGPASPGHTGQADRVNGPHGWPSCRLLDRVGTRERGQKETLY